MTPCQPHRDEPVIDGVRTPLMAAGSAAAEEAVVFVHGNPGSSVDFEPLLIGAGAIGRAVAWDAPGFGRSDAPTSFPQTVAGQSRFLRRVLDEIGRPASAARDRRPAALAS